MTGCPSCGGPHNASERPECIEKHRQYGQKYRQRNREAINNYKREYAQRPEVREKRLKYAAEYRKRPEVRRRWLVRNNTPERKAYMKGYRQRPGYQNRMRRSRARFYKAHKEQWRDYEKRPEVAKKRKDHYWRPEIRNQIILKLGNKRRQEGIGPRMKTVPEQQLERLLNEHFLGDWRYTGQGDVTIGRCAPDFFQTNGKKGIIEVFGCYHHGCSVCGLKSSHARPEHDSKRIQMFNSLGIKTLVVWEHELKDPAAVVERVRETFHA